MKSRITVVTIGVDDLERSVRFHREGDRVFARTRCRVQGRGGRRDGAGADGGRRHRRAGGRQFFTAVAPATSRNPDGYLWGARVGPR